MVRAWTRRVAWIECQSNEIYKGMYSSTILYTHHPCEPSAAVLPLELCENIVYEDIVGLGSVA